MITTAHIYNKINGDWSELTRDRASELHEFVNGHIEIDMSELQKKEQLSRITGQPVEFENNQWRVSLCVRAT